MTKPLFKELDLDGVYEFNNPMIRHFAELYHTTSLRRTTVASIKNVCTRFRSPYLLAGGRTIPWPADMERVDYYKMLDLKSDLSINDIAVSIMRLSPTDGQFFKKLALERNTRDQSTGRRNFYNSYDYISLLYRLSKKVKLNYFDRLVVLGGVTGRRMSELGVSGVFLKIPDENFKVNFIGQLKACGEKGVYPIPLLIPVDDFMRLWDSTPKYTDVLSVDQFNRKKGVNVNKHVLDIVKNSGYHFVDPATHVTFKDLRAIYAGICYHLYDKGESGFAHYIASILGHSDLDLTTAQCYDDFNFLDRNELQSKGVMEFIP